MKINKNILVGILFIVIAVILFITDILNPIIRPITSLFLMGSSNGKDILFFGLMGLFIISTQLFKDLKIDSDRYLKITLILGAVTLIAGIFVEILFRYQLGISLNTIFMTAQNGASSTSILHTHLLKSVFAEAITNIIGPYIGSEINTGIGLYAYAPEAAKLVIILLPILLITLILAIRNRNQLQTILLSFAGACLLIGSLDGGLFATPSIIGIFTIFLFFRNGECINQYFDRYFAVNEIEIKDKCKRMTPYKDKKDKVAVFIKRYLPYIALGLIILLRFSIAVIGANYENYEVDVINPSDNIELDEFPVENISYGENETVYTIDSNYNEMELLNDLKIKLYGKCDYFTETWNIFSYF